MLLTPELAGVVTVSLSWMRDNYNAGMQIAEAAGVTEYSTVGSFSN